MRATILVSGLALAVIAPCQVTKVLGGYLLRARYTKGSVLRMTTTSLVMGMGPRPVQIIFPTTLRVLDVSQGQAKVEFKLGDARSGSKSMRTGVTLIAMMDSRNVASDEKAQPHATPLPLKPVNPGSTWTAQAPINSESGNGLIMATYRFEGLRLTGGPPVAVVSYKIHGSAQGKGTETLLIKDGLLYSNTSDLRLTAEGVGMTVHSVTTRD